MHQSDSLHRCWRWGDIKVGQATYGIAIITESQDFKLKIISRRFSGNNQHQRRTTIDNSNDFVSRTAPATSSSIHRHQQEEKIDSRRTVWRIHQHQQEEETISRRTTATTLRILQHQQEMDVELALIENAFEYLTKKTYPPGCTKKMTNESLEGRQINLKREMERYSTRKEEAIQ